MYRFWFLMLLLSNIGIMGAEKIKTVQGIYSYYAPENISLEEAKRIAIDRAKIKAIADEFGTLVSQMNSSVVSNKRGESDSYFFSLGETDVKGVWIADLKDPEIQLSYERNMLIVTAEVCGRAREQKHLDYDLFIQTLCNGVESVRFKNNDKLSLGFSSPVKGYLSIWLADDNLKRVYCLVPYENGNGIARKIESRKKYLLLSKIDEEYPYGEETVLISSSDLEINRLIFVFSTSQYSIPLTEEGEYVPELSNEKFDKWLQRSRMKDENMVVYQKILEIKKDE